MLVSVAWFPQKCFPIFLSSLNTTSTSHPVRQASPSRRIVSSGNAGRTTIGITPTHVTEIPSNWWFRLCVSLALRPAMLGRTHPCGSREIQRLYKCKSMDWEGEIYRRTNEMKEGSGSELQRQILRINFLKASRNEFSGPRSLPFNNRFISLVAEAGHCREGRRMSLMY
jgi:hypothetical protein